MSDKEETKPSEQPNNTPQVPGDRREKGEELPLVKK